MTEVVRVLPSQPDGAIMARAAACLRRGGLVAFPTETVYGLGGHALDRTALARLFAAKQRPATDPLIVHVSAFDRLDAVVAQIPQQARRLADRFWPGPLTLVMPRSAAVPDEVTAGLPTVAVRVPAHPVAHALLVAADIPVAAPSANLFSRPSPTLASHVLDDLDGRIEMVIDGGPTTIGVESTVLDLTRKVPTILRPGAVTAEMLLEILPGVETLAPVLGGSAAADERKPSPGLLDRHYSPRAPLTLYEGSSRTALARLEHDARAAVDAGHVVGLVVWEEDRATLEGLATSNRRLLLCSLGSQGKPEVAAARLYATLRELDAAGVDMILVRMFSDATGLGMAIRDRLHRAAAGRIVQC